VELPRLQNPDLEPLALRLASVVAEWYEAERLSERPTRELAIGKANAGLIVLEHFRAHYPLTNSVYLSEGQGQVSGLSGASVRRIIRRFAPEVGSLGTEAGRTSRGTPAAAHRLAERLNALESEIGHPLPEDRTLLADTMQRWLIENVILAYFQRQHLHVAINPRLSSISNVASILSAARERDLYGPIAQHLVVRS
jgi:hypothetical protein